MTKKKKQKQKLPKYYEKLDIYRQSYSLQELQALRRRMAKTANQRILSLERNNLSTDLFPAVTYLKKLGRRRFSESATFYKDPSTLKRELSVLQGFLTSRVSTVVGYKKTRKKTRETFKKIYNINLTDNQFSYLLNNMDTFHETFKYFDSEGIMDLIGSITTNKQGRGRRLSDRTIYSILEAIKNNTDADSLFKDLKKVRAFNLSKEDFLKLVD